MARPTRTALTMVAKLSSVRIMTAASLDTSVPVMPMATPMSAFLSAGASFTPSPVMATMLPFGLEHVHQVDLVLRRDAGDDADVIDGRGDLGVAHGPELGAGDGSTFDAQRVGDGLGGHRVIAGDHAHPDAGGRVPRRWTPWLRRAAGRRCPRGRAA